LGRYFSYFSILLLQYPPSEIVARATAAGFALDRDSVVSALTKRIQHSDRFRRTAPNTFALLIKEGPTS